MEEKYGSYGILNNDGLDEAPMELIDGGMEKRWRESYAFDNAQRDSYGGWLLQYTIRGKGIFEREGRETEVGAGRGFLARMPENSRYYLPEGAEEPWVFLYFHFRGSAADALCPKLLRLSGPVFCADGGGAAMVMAMQMDRRLRQGYRPEKYEAGEFLYRFLCALLREQEVPGAGMEHVFVKEARVRMDRNCRQIEGIESLAEELGVSFAHFTRCFREETGISPIQYLTDARMRSAMTLLLNTGKNIGEIAGEVGFASGNYFGKVFRRHTGVSPKEYRRQRRQSPEPGEKRSLPEEVREKTGI